MQIPFKVNTRAMVQPYARVQFCRVTSWNEIETTGVESERPVVRCSQCLETTECKS